MHETARGFLAVYMYFVFDNSNITYTLDRVPNEKTDFQYLLS